MNSNNHNSSYKLAGLLPLAMRLVIGWTYFSAFWRRLIIDNKLIPNEAGYIGEKFNHFLPNALFIKPIIQYLVENPDSLYWAMVIFTLVEAIVGLMLMLGLFTRLSSIGVFMLAMGILLGSGWIGTTCLDEWQIGVLGVAGGFTLFFSGSSYYSLDYYFIKKNYPFTQKKGFRLLGSGMLPFNNLKPLVGIGAFLILGLTLFTNQVFHGGVWGTLHNKSVRPKVELSNVKATENQLSFQVYRVEGADVYGSFLIGIEVIDENGNILLSKDLNDLANFNSKDIHNYYVAKVKPGKKSLIIPLGARADLNIPFEQAEKLKGKTLRLTDISGIEWDAKIL